MPIYSYSCECGATFDARRPIDQRFTARCPACSKAGKKRDVVLVGGIKVDPGKPDWADDWTRRPKRVF